MKFNNAGTRSFIKCCFASFCLIVLLTVSTVSKFRADSLFKSDSNQKRSEVVFSKSYNLLNENVKNPALKFNRNAYHVKPRLTNSVQFNQERFRKLLWLSDSPITNLSAQTNQITVVESDGAGQDVQCNDVHHINTSSVCEFVTSNPECQAGQGFISYTDIVYCQFTGKLLPLGVSLLFLWWLFLFVGLAVTADDFFCPALKVISKTLRLSDNVAGVTFLAFGNGAPDIFSAIAAIGNAKNGDAGLAFGALFGAGVFVTSVVAGTIAIICPFDCMQRPFLRDVIFYLVAVFWAFLMIWDKIIEQYEAIGFIVLYVLYVIVVICGRYVYQRHKRFKRKALLTKDKPGIQEDEDNNISRGDDDDPGDDDGDDDSPYDQSLEIPPRDSSDESQPLLGYRRPVPCMERMKPFIEMLKKINPIDVDGWAEKKIYLKLFEIFKSPIQLLLLLTVPVVDEDKDKHNWCRYLQTFQLLSGPMFGAMATKVGFSVLFGVLPVWALILAIGFILSLIIFCTSNNDNTPVYHSVFGFLGFLVSVIWIYCIANEVVNILQTFGVVFDISDAILGLTLLAWGNSVGDFVADTVMARQGYPRMGISACFGGPMFNLLLGVGLPFTIKTIQTGTSYQLRVSLQEFILAGFLALSLVTSLVVVTFSKFKMSRAYGIILWGLYIIFLVVAILTELGIIHAKI